MLHSSQFFFFFQDHSLAGVGAEERQEGEEGIEDEAMDTVDNSSHSENSQVKKGRGQSAKIFQTRKKYSKKESRLFMLSMTLLPYPCTSIHLQFWQTQANSLPVAQIKEN